MVFDIGVQVSNIPAVASDRNPDLWLSCHGYESRSVKHLELLDPPVDRKLSFGFEFPGPDDSEDIAARLAAERVALEGAGFDIRIVGDTEFEEQVRHEFSDIARATVRPLIVADISSMNRSRIAGLIHLCAGGPFAGNCDLELVYFPSTFESHKHPYEPLESFGPVHDEFAGWPADQEMPLALLIGLGTEPRRADGIVETVEPDILGLFEPHGDEHEFLDDVRTENRRVREVAGAPTPYWVRDPQATFQMLRSSVELLSRRAQVIIVPLGPKVFCAIAVGVATSLGPEVGVWKASAGRGVRPINVQGADEPVIARMSFSRTGPRRDDMTATSGRLETELTEPPPQANL